MGRMGLALLAAGLLAALLVDQEGRVFVAEDKETNSLPPLARRPCPPLEPTWCDPSRRVREAWTASMAFRIARPPSRKVWPTGRSASRPVTLRVGLAASEVLRLPPPGWSEGEESPLFLLPRAEAGLSGLRP